MMYMLFYEDCLCYVLYMHDMDLCYYIYDIVYTYIYIKWQVNDGCLMDLYDIVAMLCGWLALIMYDFCIMSMQKLCINSLAIYVCLVSIYVWLYSLSERMLK